MHPYSAADLRGSSLSGDLLERWGVTKLAEKHNLTSVPEVFLCSPTGRTMIPTMPKPPHLVSL